LFFKVDSPAAASDLELSKVNLYILELDNWGCQCRLPGLQVAHILASLFRGIANIFRRFGRDTIVA
jgi:hypothetical protein